MGAAGAKGTVGETAQVIGTVSKELGKLLLERDDRHLETTTEQVTTTANKSFPDSPPPGAQTSSQQENTCPCRGPHLLQG